VRALELFCRCDIARQLFRVVLAQAIAGLLQLAVQFARIDAKIRSHLQRFCGNLGQICVLQAHCVTGRFGLLFSSEHRLAVLRSGVQLEHHASGRLCQRLGNVDLFPVCDDEAVRKPSEKSLARASAEQP
jgi:hypothetical protein